jgi:hypothetical protein
MIEPELTPEPKPRKRRTKAEIEAADSETVKPARKRKTQAEKDAERLAEINKPVDPKIWLFLGGLLLFVAVFIFLDPITFAEAGQPGGEGMWIRDVLVILVGILGKTPTVIILGALSLISFGLGIRGWLTQRSGADDKPDQTM